MSEAFLKFWKLMDSGSGQAPPLASVGRVISAAPLRIQLMGLVYEPADIRLNAHLPLGDVEPDDDVFCLTNDGWQTILVLCKVVTA